MICPLIITYAYAWCKENLSSNHSFLVIFVYAQLTRSLFRDKKQKNCRFVYFATYYKKKQLIIYII